VRDLLYGGRGEDLLDGGAGNDRLNGGFGEDNLSGGSGNTRSSRCRAGATPSTAVQANDRVI